MGLRTIIGRGEVAPTATHLQRHLGHGPTEGRRCPRGHAPQALCQLPFGRCLVDVPGPVEYPMAQLACAVLLNPTTSLSCADQICTCGIAAFRAQATKGSGVLHTRNPL